MQLGSYDNMIMNSVKSSTGYIQIHANGYWDDKIIDNVFQYDSKLHDEIMEQGNIDVLIPRVESFALASSGKHTKGAAVIGTKYDLEDQAIGFTNKIIKGEGFSDGSEGVLISQGLAQYLELDVADTVVLLSQGYHGATAAAALPIVGIIEFIQPDMNNQMIYMDLSKAQQFYDIGNSLTSISLMLINPDLIRETQQGLAAINPESLEVMTWDEMLIELVQGIQSDNISGLFMLGILYLVVGFGILGTILMMTMERKKEFGIMVAVGMHRSRLSVIIFLETMIIGILGVLAGIIGSLPLIYYFYNNPIPLTGEAAEAVLEYNMEPIMPFALEHGYFINQGLVVIIITLLTVIYPIIVINRFRIINAIKGR
jgi:ABC-type lipoprotein release transport system permease subunit